MTLIYQISSHSEIVDVRTSKYEVLGATIQLVTVAKKNTLIEIIFDICTNA